MTLNKIIQDAYKAVIATTLFSLVASTAFSGEIKYIFDEGKGTVYDNNKVICSLNIDERNNPKIIVGYEGEKIKSISNGVDSLNFESDNSKGYAFAQLFYDKARECELDSLNR